MLSLDQRGRAFLHPRISQVPIRERVLLSFAQKAGLGIAAIVRPRGPRTKQQRKAPEGARRIAL